MNLDLQNPSGHPDPAQLSGIPYVRLLYNVSRGTGALDFEHSFNQYNPYITALQNAGIKVILILAHQTYGEGVPGWPRWEDFSLPTWSHFTDVFNEAVINGVVRKFAGRGIIWQLWNEPDSKDGRASVRMSAPAYGAFFRGVSERIRRYDPSATVLTAGFNSGPGDAYSYFKLANIAPDGIALHEYGRGAASNPNYRQFGTIEQSLDYWKVRTNIPIWLTEFGVLNAPNEPEDKVAGYARDFIKAARSKGVNAICYYAYGRMDNGYGVIAPNGQTRTKLLDALKYNSPPSGGGNIPTPIGGHQLTGIPGSLRFRTAPSLSGGIITLLKNDDWIVPLDEKSVTAEGYKWRKVSSGGDSGWIAVAGNGLRIGVLL
jgi:hypothetical protein